MLGGGVSSRGRFARAIFLLLDGARADVFQDLLKAGELPNVARHVAEPGRVTTATTVFPSVTGVAYAPFITGFFPARTNLTGVRWFDRRRYAGKRLSVSRFRNYSGLGHFMMDRDLSRSVMTLFEILRPSSNIFGTISRGTGVRRNAFLLRRVPWALHFLLTGDWAPIDTRANQLLLRSAMRRNERFTFHTTLQVDEHSHLDGPFSPRARQGYKAFDRAVGALVSRLRSAGQLDRTLLCIGADHGHSEVHDHLDLELFFERRGLRTLYYPRAFQRWFDCDVAVMVGGNGMGHIHLRGAGWGEDETGDERLDHMPGVMDDLLAEDAVDLLAWRPHGHGVVRVRSRRGEADLLMVHDHVTYRVRKGDPFGYGPLPEQMTRHQALELTRSTEYPDGLVQIAQIFDAPRAGDLIVTASRGWDLRAHDEHRPHRSGHGSLHREHMNVPFAMSHPFDDSAVRTVDAFPTMLGLLGENVPARLGAIDGRSLLGKPVMRPAVEVVTPAIAPAEGSRPAPVAVRAARRVRRANVPSST